MFLQVSVCPQGSCAWSLGACVVARGVRSCRRVMHGCRGMCVFAGGGGVHGCWGACAVAGGPSVVAGGHVWWKGGVHGEGGMHGKGCVCGRGHMWDMTRYRNIINEWAVRILLESILVIITSSLTTFFFFHKPFRGHQSVLFVVSLFCWRLLLWKPSLVYFIVCMQWISLIHLWCHTCWPLEDQHGSRTV